MWTIRMRAKINTGARTPTNGHRLQMVPMECGGTRADNSKSNENHSSCSCTENRHFRTCAAAGKRTFVSAVENSTVQRLFECRKPFSCLHKIFGRTCHVGSICFDCLTSSKIRWAHWAHWHMREMTLTGYLLCSVSFRSILNWTKCRRIVLCK